MEPQFRFCTSADGTRIAYAIYGGGPPLMLVPGYSLGMHTLYPMPEARAYIDALAARTTLVMFDRRGTGASARAVDDLSLEAQAQDLAAIANAAGFDRFALFAEDGPLASCARYATEHHTRVDRLVFWVTKGIDATLREEARSYRQDWSYARRVRAGIFYPDGPVSLQRAVSRATKDTVSAEMEARYVEMLVEVDYEALLPPVSAPALVLSRQQFRAAAREGALRLAGLLPNSELRFVSGNAVTPFPGHEPVVEAIFAFMGLGEAATGRGRFATVLFTDLVNHTEMMQRLGDAKGRTVLREHERITRQTLKEHGGVEVKTDGDSFMVSFSSVVSAVDCAVALQRAFAAYNETAPESIAVRMGLNAGEPIEEDSDLFGSTVILAARIAAKAGAGAILTSVAIRELCAGKGFRFEDRGEVTMQGFHDAVRIFEVQWRE